MDGDKPLFATENDEKDEAALVKQEFKLFIKASPIDKETRGSCPECQMWFMVAYLMAQKQDGVNFSVYTVQESSPPKEFTGWSKKFPVVLPVNCVDKKGQPISGDLFDTYDELEGFFEAINRECPELKRHNKENSEAVLTVNKIYTTLNHVLTGAQQISKLEYLLRDLDKELDNDNVFFIDDQLTFADCYLLPRLQHVKVTAKRYMNYEIPSDCKAVWRYLKESYKQPAFTQTMPSDQDIVFHYSKKSVYKPPKLVTTEPFSFDTSIPEDIMNEANGENNGQHVEQQDNMVEMQE